MSFRRAPFIALALTLAAGTGSIVAAGSASAAGPWFVAPGGSNSATCLTLGAPCASIQGVLAKSGFANNDTINVAAGTYTGLTVFSTKGANVVGSGAVVLDGNNAGTVVSVTGAVAVKLSGLTITKGTNNASPYGGGLRVQAGSVTTQNVNITNSKSVIGAGAVVYAGASLTMNGGTVSGNTGASSGGGGIFNAGTTNLTNVDVTNNAGLNGGGLYDAAASTLNVTGGSIANNTATSIGGGVYALGATKLSGVNTHDNTASYGGGAAVGNATTLTVEDGAISSNAATSAGQTQGWGGGVYVAGKTANAATGVLKITGTTLNGNTATGNAFLASGLGGGIFSAGTVTLSGANLSGNKVSGTGTLGGLGGGIYHGGSAPADPQLTITDTQIKGGSVTNAVVGGGIVAGSPFTATNLTVSGMVAQVAGGIYTTSNATLNDSAITDNAANLAGGGIGGGIDAVRPSASATSTLILDNTDVTGNTSSVYGGGISLGFGVTAEARHGSKVDDNVAFSGAGVFNSGALTVRDSSVSSNSSGFQGGGVYNGSTTATDTPSLSLINAAIDDNSAASGGGGLLTIKGASLNSTGGHVNGNSAVGGGGLAVGDGANSSFDGTDFVDNTASNLGGGAILNSGNTTIANSSLRGNHAAHTTGSSGVGAAIYSGSNSNGASTSLKVRSSTISDNDAYAGSAILTYSPGSGATNNSSIDNTTITGNTNLSNIGAVEQFHPMTITNSTITNNSATGNTSGALAMASPTQVGLAGTIISGNSGPECSGAVKDGGRNLTDPSDATCGFTGAKQDISAAPLLGTLDDNGGPTKTFLPGPASPALDKILAATGTGLTDAVTGNAVTLCGSTDKDQRGIARPQGAKCDIGAVEVKQVVPTVSGPASADYTLNSSGTPVVFTTDGTPLASLSYSGTLPAGVTFHDNSDGTATLSGTPTAGPGGVYTITVKGTNEAGTGTKSFDLKLHEAPSLTGPMASTYTVGQAGGPDLFKQIGGFPVATLSSSDLPGGISFTPQADGTGTVAGTPNTGTGGHYNITITGDNGTPPPATWPFSLTINEKAGIDGPASSTFTVGTAGTSAPFTTTGFPKPDLSATGLPDGLSLSGNGTAKITGTPVNSTGGEYDAIVTAHNGIGADATKTTHVTVNEAPELSGPSDARLVAGVHGELVFSADGYPIADLSYSGNLPAGVTFDNHHNGTATLGGTPTAGSVGTYTITVTAGNGTAPDSVIHLTLEVVPHLAITSTTLPDAPHLTSYSATVGIIGGLPNYTFSLQSGSLPAGLTLNSNGTITGSSTGPITTSTFTVKVTDGEDPAVSETKQLSIKVVKGSTSLAADPVVVSSSSPGGDLHLNLNVGIVKATLTGGVPALPLAGETVVFKAGNSTVCTAKTGADGRVTCTMSLIGTVLVTLNGGITANYAGSTVWEPSTSSAKLLG